jgi:hypothetical protein
VPSLSPTPATRAVTIADARVPCRHARRRPQPVPSLSPTPATRAVSIADASTPDLIVNPSRDREGVVGDARTTPP